jgi:hypothetical protein
LETSSLQGFTFFHLFVFFVSSWFYFLEDYSNGLVVTAGVWFFAVGMPEGKVAEKKPLRQAICVGCSDEAQTVRGWIAA